MGEIAVGDEMRARPQGHRPQDRVARQAGDARPLGIEPFGMRAAEGERIGRPRRQRRQQRRHRHRQKRRPGLPRRRRPDLDVRRARRRDDRPAEQRRRDEAIGQKKAALAERGDAGRPHARPRKNRVRDEKHRQRRDELTPAHPVLHPVRRRALEPFAAPRHRPIIPPHRHEDREKRHAQSLLDRPRRYHRPGGL